MYHICIFAFFHFSPESLFLKLIEKVRKCKNAFLPGAFRRKMLISDTHTRATGRMLEFECYDLSVTE